MWGGCKVSCYSPETGCKLNEIALPDKNVSCCVIGGKEHNTLFVTTARDENEDGGKMYVVGVE